ncbi:peptidase, M61 (glycyl aminopeptidase) family protein [Stigmatella aurantiaca DW4/3-1]|nr:peptidase, M61 (glycyl aminopeptidase) family protein [Stigmatella aurantiaca DW4/3-1]
MGGRAPVSRYAVLLRPDYPSGMTQGTPREGSIQVHTPREVPLERVHQGALLSTLAHEYLHTWGREAGAELRVSSEPELGGEMRWFIEGFVHYLAQLALLESGAQELSVFLSTLGQAYASVSRHPLYGQESLAQASARFFDDPAAREFSYSGGMVVAFLCDLELRARGQGPLARFLDQVPPGRLPVEWGSWLAAWTRHTGSPEPVASWVQTASPLPFLDRVRRAGGEVRERERWVFDAGFDVRLEGLTVASIGPLVGAQGLVRGDVVVSVNGRAISSAEAFLRELDPTGKPSTVQLRRGSELLERPLHRASRKEYEVSASGGSVLRHWSLGYSHPGGG